MERDRVDVVAWVSDLVETDGVIHVRHALAEHDVRRLDELLAVHLVLHLVDRAVDDLDPAAIARVVVDGTVLAAVPHDQDERVGVVVRGDEVARVVLGGIDVRKAFELTHVAVVAFEQRAEDAALVQGRLGVLLELRVDGLDELRQRERVAASRGLELLLLRLVAGLDAVHLHGRALGVGAAAAATGCVGDRAGDGVARHGGSVAGWEDGWLNGTTTTDTRLIPYWNARTHPRTDGAWECCSQIDTQAARVATATAAPTAPGACACLRCQRRFDWRATQPMGRDDGSTGVGRVQSRRLLLVIVGSVPLRT